MTHTVSRKSLPSLIEIILFAQALYCYLGHYDGRKFGTPPKIYNKFIAVRVRVRIQAILTRRTLWRTVFWKPKILTHHTLKRAPSQRFAENRRLYLIKDPFLYLMASPLLYPRTNPCVQVISIYRKFLVKFDQ